MVKETPISTSASPKIRIFLMSFTFSSKPIFSHFISSGSGALVISTLGMGNSSRSSLSSVQISQILLLSLFNFSIVSLALEYLRVTKMVFLSSRSTCWMSDLRYVFVMKS